jgi:hypothetical protein
MVTMRNWLKNGTWTNNIKIQSKWNSKITKAA